MSRLAARAPEPQPLAGVRIAVTRAGERGSPLAAALRAKGATVYEVPLTRIETLDLAPLHEAARRLVDFDWILLTSVNAVEHLARVVTERGAEAAMATRRLAVVGAATAAAADAHGWRTPTGQPATRPGRLSRPTPTGSPPRRPPKPTASSSPRWKPPS